VEEVGPSENVLEVQLGGGLRVAGSLLVHYLSRKFGLEATSAEAALECAVNEQTERKKEVYR
jgi:hypothetical protein